MSTAPTSIAPVSAGSAIKPQTLEEKVVWYYILGMYPLYFLGLLPFAATIVGLLAPAYVFFNWLRQPDDAPKQDRVRIPVGVWVWIAFMVVIQVTLIAAHVDFGMSDRVWRTSARMATKGFYVLTFFIIAGGCLNIRPQILYRATSIFCVQNLVASAIVYVWSRTGAESITYMPPLAGKTGGYPILLYLVEGGENRQWLFAPWAPALGFAASIYLCLVYRDPNKWLRLLAILGVIAMVLGSGSRTGRVCLIVVPVFTWVLSNFLLRPGVQMLTGVGGFVAGVIGPQIFQFLKDYRASLDAERAGSTEVREAINSVSLHRWRTEAPIWGHGMNLYGPAITTNKPLGSHHTWIGVLFVHGIVGGVAFAVTLAWSFLELLIKSQWSKDAEAALAVLLVLMIYSTTENLDSIAYLYWPGLILLGIAFKQPLGFTTRAQSDDLEESTSTLSSSTT